MSLSESFQPEHVPSPLEKHQDKLVKAVFGAGGAPKQELEVDRDAETVKRDKELRDVARSQMKEADKFIRWMQKPEYRVMPGHAAKIDELLTGMHTTLGMAKEVLWKNDGEFRSEVADYSIFQSKIEELEHSFVEAETRTSMEITTAPETLDARPLESLLVDDLVIGGNPDYVVRRMFREQGWPVELAGHATVEKISTDENGEVALVLKQRDEDAPLHIERVDGHIVVPSMGVIAVRPGAAPSYELYPEVIDGMKEGLAYRERAKEAELAKKEDE